MHAWFICLLCCIGQLQGSAAVTAGTADGRELWGYVQTRPKVHLFWWYYQSPASHRVALSQPWPTILWLQGGPGGSGVGRGNFLEIGPLDLDMNPRSSTWLSKADLIFVDNPVGVGYSYAEDPSALAKTDFQAAMDVTELIKVLAKEIPTLQSSPLFLVGESYGGKFAAMIGVSVARAIHAGALNLTLGGVVLGNSWISPDDFTLSYPRLLHSMSRLDDNAVDMANRMAVTVKEQMARLQFTDAYTTWTNLLALINFRSGRVNMENLMFDNTVSPVLFESVDRPLLSPGNSKGARFVPYTISDIMNGHIKQKLQIIPENVMWQDVSVQVFDALANDFMKPAINEVDELLSYGVHVTVYNGQVDVICSTLGAEAWVMKLKWDGLHDFLSLPRKSLNFCHSYNTTDAFIRSHKNLHFYWVLRAGHMVPVDQPCTAVHMISRILQTPTAS